MTCVCRATPDKTKDITGRAPIVHTESFNSRASMDSRRMPRSSVNHTTFERPPPSEEEEAKFEEVGLNDDKDKQQPKKRSFMSRFGDSSTNESQGDGKHHFNILSSRKRGQSGSGAELNSMGKGDSRPSSKGQPEVVR